MGKGKPERGQGRRQERLNLSKQLPEEDSLGILNPGPVGAFESRPGFFILDYLPLNILPWLANFSGVKNKKLFE